MKFFGFLYAGEAEGLAHSDVQSCAVRGDPLVRNLNVRYTLDGSDPDVASTAHSGGFEVEPGTRVKASVLDGEEFLFKMEEYFAPGQGLYWGDGRETLALDEMGAQAEDATFEGGSVESKIRGFRGSGDLDFGKNGGSVEWYQENDGRSGMVTLQFRYSGTVDGKKGGLMKLAVNGKVVAPELFFENSEKKGRDWKTVRIDVPLKSGANRINLPTCGHGGMYIDELVIH